ncbi:GNAT family N-acetyltransferase [Priestia megaterium]|uniref:GNAT family N-acetyltransferase n=1 Tax=Priestia megaterium TaxID=1404 RepID=UPI00189FCAC0|nr:GNAT family N-acetyltransferase [Priestia megaterium]
MEVIDRIGCKVYEISRFSDIRRIEEKWLNHIDTSIYNLTNTYDWFYSTWKSLSGVKKVKALLIENSDGKLLSIIPLVFNDLNNRIIVPTSIIPLMCKEQYEVCIGVLLDYMNSFHQGKDLFFEEIDFHFQESSRLVDFLENNKIPFDMRIFQKTPVLKTSLNYQEYFENRKKKIKKALGNKRDRLNLIGDYHVREFQDSNEITIAMDKIHEVDSTSWKFEEESDMASREGQLVFYDSLARRLAKNNAIKLRVLEFKETEEPIAFEYIINFDNHYLIAKHSYKEKYKKFSPGVILRNELLESILTGSDVVVDTWGSLDPFKSIWCDEVVDRYSILIKNKN